MECGTVLPQKTEDILSNLEKGYFQQYDGIMTQYMAQTGLTLSADLYPPKELYVEVRCLKSVGKIQTENGIFDLQKGQTYHMKRQDAQQLIKQHILQQCETE